MTGLLIRAELALGPTFRANCLYIVYRSSHVPKRPAFESRGREFRFDSIPVSVPKNEYVALRSILSIGSRIDLYVYYVVVGFSDLYRWESFKILEC